MATLIKKMIKLSPYDLVYKDIVLELYKKSCT